MILLKKIIALLTLTSFSLIMFSCTSTQPANNVIDIDSAEPTTLLMSDHFDDIEYIPLETSEECLVGRIQNLQVVDGFIVVISSGNCHLFDRNTGKFIRKVGMKGNGPKEYNGLLQGLSVNEQKKTVIASTASGLIEYSLVDGSVVEPKIKTEISMPTIGSYMHIADDVWVKGEVNFMGDNPNQLFFFDREKIVDSIPNTSFFTRKGNAIGINKTELYLYRYNNNAHFKFMFSDTIFDITNRTKEPKWILQTQNSLSKIFALKGDPKKMNEVTGDYHSVQNIHETDAYLLFNTWYQKGVLQFLYLKDKQLLVKVENEGFVNDIDGGQVFWPTYTTSDQNMITVYEAHKFIEEPNDDDDDEAVNNTPKSEKLKTLLTKIGENDNPIIVIAKPKK